MRYLAPLYIVSLIVSSALCTIATAHPNHHEGDHSKRFASEDPFRQLEELWPTPDELRLASGAPGPQYWQQKVDYQINVILDDHERSLKGEAQISYDNQSPHTLEYLWLQLDQNRFKESSASHLSRTFEGNKEVYYGSLSGPRNLKQRDPGVKIHFVKSLEGVELKTTTVDTMMRVDLPKPLKTGEQFRFKIKWSVPVLRHKDTWARAGYEDLKSLTELDKAIKSAKDKLKKADSKPGDEGNLPSSEETSQQGTAEKKDEGKSELEQKTKVEEPSKAEEKDTAKAPVRRIYEIAQWYPRLAAYTDVTGWQNKQFLGNGEFTLEFGDFLVKITAPDHFTLTATGELMNPSEVLSVQQRERLAKAEQAETPQWVITPDEARAQGERQPTGTKTWIFGASQVRDFAFAASNTFIWDAMAHRVEGRESVMAMSFYPPEAETLWKRYSTHAVLHTLEQYERYTFPYPYPVAISVNGPIFGMEYPMISFNGVRPEPDGTYSKDAKYALIGVIIHEVGHFFFPMIVNSDERQWTWLDEGINSFLQYQAERAWEEDFPSWNGGPDTIIPYMTSDEQRPIMTNSESLLQFGSNAYGKPTAALSLLRETIMGPELFDEAFRSYARRWQFKRPMPSDFFRTLEDVSAIDLDWFWRGWFYSTAYVDIQVAELKRLRLKTKDPRRDKPVDQLRHEEKKRTIVAIRDEGRERRVKRYPELADFYNRFDQYAVTPAEIESAEQALTKLKEEEPEKVQELQTKGYFYELTLINKGGLVSPLPLRLELEGGRQELRRIPAEVWRKNHYKVKLFLDLDAPLIAVEFDPFRETGDANIRDNRFPQTISDEESFELKSWSQQRGQNPMQKEISWTHKQRAKRAKRNKSNKIQSAEEKPAEEKSAEEKPAEEKPTEEKSAEEKPAEEKPAEEKPAEEKPAEEKPAEILTNGGAKSDTLKVLEPKKEETK